MIGVANSNNLLPSTENSQYQILSQLLTQLSPASTRNYLLQIPATGNILQPSYQIISYVPKLNQGPIYIPQVYPPSGQQVQYNPQTIYREQIPYYQVQPPSYYQQQIYYQPTYRQPTYQQPINYQIYSQPIYRQPVKYQIYRQPVQQPINYQVYRQPVYQQPIYRQPSVTYRPQQLLYTPRPTTYYQPQFYQRYYNTPYYYQAYQPQGQVNLFQAPYNFYNRRAQVTVPYQPPPYQIQQNYVQPPRPTYQIQQSLYQLPNYRPQYYQFPQITVPQVPYRPQTYYTQVQQQILTPRPQVQLPQFQYYPRTQQR